MGEQFKVEPEHLRGYAGLVERNAGHFTTIEGHAREKGGDTSGFTGLLSLLVPVADGVVNLYGETLQFANSKLTAVQGALEGAAEAYERAETLNVNQMTAVDTARSAAASTIPTVGGAQ